MVRKVRHTDGELFACLKSAQSDFMEGIYCNGVLKSEIEFLYPRWPHALAVIAEIVITGPDKNALLLENYSKYFDVFTRCLSGVRSLLIFATYSICILYRQVFS